MLAPTNNPVVPPIETTSNEMESKTFISSLRQDDIIYTTQRIRDLNDKFHSRQKERQTNKQIYETLTH